MMAVVEFHNMEPAAINVEVNIALFKIWRDGFPDLHFWMQLLDCTPSCIADSFAMCLGGHKQQVEIATFTINLYDYTSNRLAVLYDPVCLTAVDSLLNSLMGNDLTVFFEVVVPESRMNCSRSSGVSGLSVTFAIATSYNSYTINPAKADIPISPIGEIPFFRTFLEPKYTVPRTIVIITAVVSTDNAPELPTLC